LTGWSARSLANTVYAVLAERADALDIAEVALYPHTDKDGAEDLCAHRASLDRWLAEPVGRQAAAEAALLKALGG
jgi:hypothetical protein